MKEKIKQALLKFNPLFTNEELELGLSYFEEKEFKAKD